MSSDVREALVDELESQTCFGARRLKEVAKYLKLYAQPKLCSEDADVHDYAKSQRWAALAYLEPGRAALELRNALSEAFASDKADLVRLASIVIALQRPLDDDDLVNYAKALAEHSFGNLREAEELLWELNSHTNSSPSDSTVNVSNSKAFENKNSSIKRFREHAKKVVSKSLERLNESTPWNRIPWPSVATYTVASVVSVSLALGSSHLIDITFREEVPLDDSNRKLAAVDSSLDQLNYSRQDKDSPLPESLDLDQEASEARDIPPLDRQLDETQSITPEQNKPPITDQNVAEAPSDSSSTDNTSNSSGETEKSPSESSASPNSQADGSENANDSPPSK
ncbi:MAG: hypothetical protein AAFU53_14600, partial [Cyanobacteria bacterium J06632_3]